MGMDKRPNFGNSKITSVKWLPYNEDENYTLTLTFSNIPSFIKKNNDGTKQIAVCNWSKNEKNRSYLDLGVYSSEIRNVPMLNHIYFSPIHMNCSPARENQRRTQSSHSGLYSGPIGAFLNVHEPLIPAFNWLKKNNRLIKKYASDITRPLPEEPALLQLPVVQ
ncbi:5612_t:CDS:2 [Entrophospora sp. SA101]|nr:5611_t:CDS:2 [Entrophospora sp. SA101]CAJ0644147.1 5612_t:CDS:2 [Entrophospora sp. SA101]CAJ0833763.1 5996_t:CDS:2 [Entrophospora sp. SA101]